MRLRITQIKIVPEKGDLDGNFAKLMACLRAVAPHKPDVVVTPECFLDGYVATEKRVTKRTILRYAIDPDTSEFAAGVADWGARNRAWVFFGCVTRAPAGGAHNTTLIYNRKGHLIGRYHKVHLQTHDRKFTPGNSLPVFDGDFGTFGVMICADRRWPETARTLALRGARLIVNPKYGMCNSLNLAMMRTRSYENEMFIISPDPHLALVTGPKGQVLTCVRSPRRRLVTTEIDLAEVTRTRRTHSHLKERQVHVYERSVSGRIQAPR